MKGELIKGTSLLVYDLGRQMIKMSTKRKITALSVVKSKEQYNIQKAAVQQVQLLLAAVASPPSELNRQFLSVLHCTYRKIIRASNFACIHTVILYVLLILCAHSRSPTMHSIQLVV